MGTSVKAAGLLGLGWALRMTRVWMSWTGGPQTLPHFLLHLDALSYGAIGCCGACHAALMVGGTGFVGLLGAGSVCHWWRRSWGLKEMWQTAMSAVWLGPPGRVWKACMGLSQSWAKCWPHLESDWINPL